MKLRTSILSLGLATLLGAPAVADDPLRITDLAPESTFLVIGADDMDATCRHFEQTPLAGLWRTEAVQDLVGESFTDGIDMMMESLRDEGIESEPELPRSMGVAIYGDLDEETGMSRAFIVGFAEFKDMGDDGDRMMEMLVKEGVDEGMVRVDRREVRGREVMVIETVEVEEEDMDDEFGGDFDAMMMLGDPSEMAPDLSVTYVVRDGGRVIFANDMLAIDDALAAVDGDGRDGMSKTEDWRKIEAQLGETDAYLALLTDPLQELLAPMFMGPLGLVRPMIQEAFGDVRGYGFGATVPADSAAASMVLTASILAPDGKEGLLSLFSEESATGQAPPAAVAAGATAYGRMNVDFKKVVPFFNDLAAAIPMGGEEIEMYLDQFGPIMEGALATMGPAVHTISTVRRPIEIDSAATTVVIPTSDPEKVMPLLSMFGPSMGMEPRDFLGETLWSDPINGVAVAVAGNWVVAGSPRGVEQVMRGLGDRDDDTLAGSPAFRSAVGKLPKGDSVGWGWVDTVSQYAVQRETFEEMMDGLGGGAFDEFGPADGLDLSEAGILVDLMDELSPKELGKYVGPTVWNFTSDEDGLVYRQWFLAPVAGD